MKACHAQEEDDGGVSRNPPQFLFRNSKTVKNEEEDERSAVNARRAGEKAVSRQKDLHQWRTKEDRSER
jgi:hypothetical protein